MQWQTYKRNFIKVAKANGKKEEYIKRVLDYAKRLFDQNLPIIFDQKHLTELLGIDSEYIHRMSNSASNFYRKFEIPKRNGGLREIHEPLPDLKRVQVWILREILYKKQASKFSKAYIPGGTLKDNARFHRKQKMVLKVDLKNYFQSIKIGRVICFYRLLGYENSVAVMLANLCCYEESLPQGAPTSPYLSNLITKEMDENLAQYVMPKGIRYTRYADDLTFSGCFSPGEILREVNYQVGLLGLTVNSQKTKLIKQNRQQKVTGIVVNEKMQVERKYRDRVRQEIYYIKTFGLESHLQRIKETREYYIEHLRGKINFIKHINPNDKSVNEWLAILDKHN